MYPCILIYYPNVIAFEPNVIAIDPNVNRSIPKYRWKILEKAETKWKYKQEAGNISYFLIGAKFYKAPNIGIAASNFSGDRISEERVGVRAR